MTKWPCVLIAGLSGLITHIHKEEQGRDVPLFVSCPMSCKEIREQTFLER